jgi:hypothetical protein
MGEESLAERTTHEVEAVIAGVPRWPAAIAILLVGALYMVISDTYTIGPDWLLPGVTIALLAVLSLARLRGYTDLSRVLSFALAISLTVTVATSAALLVAQLVRGLALGRILLRDAAFIWVANIITFALWYWTIDGGGPAKRHPGRHASADFAFPQQQLDDDGIVEGWSPGFLDYLFLAFNTSTALSPTDTLVLSRQAKGLMMLQATISLVVVGVIAARAVNILGS